MDNKPQIPTLKESQNKPQLKIKGLASGLSLIDRLKQFKKKDLAFILAGLGVLFMAPLAEHFMMSPDNGAGGPGDMTQGTSSLGKGGFGGATPYEPGISGLAPGSLAGSGSDVITPLNVRDPSALVMGPNGQQQPTPTASAPAAPPPPPPPPSSSSRSDDKWNDALSAGKAAGRAAVAKAALPVPKVNLSAGGLRGLGAVSGGSGASGGLAPISSNGLASGNVAHQNSLQGQSGTGIKGVGARGPGSGAGGINALEALKNKAAAQAGDFNRAGPGGSAGALEAAAMRDMGSGGSGGGAGEGNGASDKSGGGSNVKDSKSLGESLDFLRQKEEMQKQLELKYKKLEAGDMDLEWYKIRNKLMEDGISTLFTKGLVEPFANAFGAKISGLVGGSASQMVCWTTGTDQGKDGQSNPNFNPTPRASVPYCSKTDASKPTQCLADGNNHLMNGSSDLGLTCKPGADAKPGSDPKSGSGVSNGAGADLGAPDSENSLNGVCSGLLGLQSALSANAAVEGLGKTKKEDVEAALKLAQQLAIDDANSSGRIGPNSYQDGACKSTGLTTPGGLKRIDTVNTDISSRLNLMKDKLTKSVALYKDKVGDIDSQVLERVGGIEKSADTAVGAQLKTIGGQASSKDAGDLSKAIMDLRQSALDKAFTDGKYADTVTSRKTTDQPWADFSKGDGKPESLAITSTLQEEEKDLNAKISALISDADKIATGAGGFTNAEGKFKDYTASLKGYAKSVGDFAGKTLKDAQTAQSQAVDSLVKGVAPDGALTNAYEATKAVLDVATPGKTTPPIPMALGNDKDQTDKSYHGAVYKALDATKIASGDAGAPAKDSLTSWPKPTGDEAKDQAAKAAVVAANGSYVTDVVAKNVTDAGAKFAGKEVLGAAVEIKNKAEALIVTAKGNIDKSGVSAPGGSPAASTK